MSSGLAVAALPRSGVIDLYPTLEPYLVEVIAPFWSGTVDEAVRQSAIVVQTAVDALSATKITGEGLATGGGDLTEDRKISVPKSTPDQAKAGTDDATVITPALLSAVIAYVFSQPNVLANMLPSTLPSQAGVPWNNGGLVAIS